MKCKKERKKRNYLRCFVVVTVDCCSLADVLIKLQPMQVCILLEGNGHKLWF
uniref:Uncharacterized protein n=1 Tax=Rhizophora mucronata TaxID=61149 RepID=A0A2P2PZY4_RHIMU